MKFNTTIALAAMATVLALPATAEAKARAHHARAADAQPEEGLSAAEQLRLAQEQLNQLQAQVNALQAKLEATAAKADTAANSPAVVAASAKADKALAAANDAKAAVAKSSKAVEWAAGTKVGGAVFFNFSNVDAISNGTKLPGNGTGVFVKRVYLSVDHKFNDVFSANITADASNVVGNTSQYANTDAANSSGVTSCTSTSKTLPVTLTCTSTGTAQTTIGRGLYLKKAYVQAKINPALILRVGAADTPWIPYIDNITGLRYVENDLTDRTSFGTSADWGVHVLGDLGQYVSYQVSVTDGAGYRKLYVTKNVDVEGRISANYKGVFAAVGGYTGKRAQGVENLVGGTPHTAQRLNFAGGYKNDRFTIGGEYFTAKNWNAASIKFSATNIEDRDEGYSIFGSAKITPKWMVFGRYDWVKTRADINNNPSVAVRDHYFNTGIQFEPLKNVDLSLVYKRDIAGGGTISTSNGTIGGSGTTGHGVYNEVGLFGQVKF